MQYKYKGKIQGTQTVRMTARHVIVLSRINKILGNAMNVSISHRLGYVLMHSTIERYANYLVLGTF